MKKLFTKLEAYLYLTDQGKDVSWVANVLFTFGSHTAKNLVALAKLHKAGKQIGSIGYTMPYNLLYVDGKHVTPEQMREMASKL